MLRFTAVLAAIAFLSAGPITAAHASGTCANPVHGKCPTKTGAKKAKPAPKTSSHPKAQRSREDFTPEQRALILESARQLCKQKFGAEATVYRLNYAKMEVTCTNNTR